MKDRLQISPLIGSKIIYSKMYLFLFMCVCMYACINVESMSGDFRRALHPLGLELTAFVRCLFRKLGIELRVSPTVYAVGHSLSLLFLEQSILRKVFMVSCFLFSTALKNLYLFMHMCVV